MTARQSFAGAAGPAAAIGTPSAWILDTEERRGPRLGKASMQRSTATSQHRGGEAATGGGSHANRSIGGTSARPRLSGGVAGRTGPGTGSDVTKARTVGAAATGAPLSRAEISKVCTEFELGGGVQITDPGPHDHFSDNGALKSGCFRTRFLSFGPLSRGRERSAMRSTRFRRRGWYFLRGVH